MKRLFIFVFILITISSYGGDAEKKKGFHPEIKFGAAAGLNMAKILYQSQNPVQSDFTLVWQAGIYASIRTNQKISFQPELLYSVKGTMIPGFSPNFIVHLNYIEIPFLLRYNIGRRFNIFGGPYLGILVSGSSSMMTTIYSNSQSESFLKERKPLDIGTVIGLEHQWANGFNIGIKYSQGLYNISQLHPFGFPNLLLIPEYNLVFSLYVGWTFLKF